MLKIKKSSMRDATRITPFAWEHLRSWLLMGLLSLQLYPVGARSWQLKYHHACPNLDAPFCVK